MFLKIYKRDTVKQNSRTSSLRASRSTQQVRKKNTSRLHFAASKSDFFFYYISLPKKKSSVLMFSLFSILNNSLKLNK